MFIQSYVAFVRFILHEHILVRELGWSYSLSAKEATCYRVHMAYINIWYRYVRLALFEGLLIFVLPNVQICQMVL